MILSLIYQRIYVKALVLTLTLTMFIVQSTDQNQKA